MLWVSLAVVLLVGLLFVLRARSMGPLFSNQHLAEVAAGLPELKRRALLGEGDRLPSFQTSALAIAYSITRDEMGWIHHLSVSNPVTAARAAGTFFLGLLRGLLHLEGYPAEAFVSQTHVFHLVVCLSDEQQKAFVERSLEPKTPGELRAIAAEGQQAILPLLEERVVPVPEDTGGPS